MNEKVRPLVKGVVGEGLGELALRRPGLADDGGEPVRALGGTHAHGLLEARELVRLTQERGGVVGRPHVARELGLRFMVPTPEAARDPALFLDFRAARRWLRRHCDGADVLNVFAYTCAPPLLRTGTTPRGQLMPTPWYMEFLVSDHLRINPRFKID